MEAKNRCKIDQFICISGLTINVYDFLRIWNGEAILPMLSPSEEEEINRLTNSSSYPTSIIPGDEVSFIGFVNPESKVEYVESAQLKKLKKIQTIITNFQKSKSSLKLDINLHQILSKIYDNSRNFQEYGAYIAASASISEQDLEIINSAINEVNQLSGLSASYQSRYVSPESAKSIVSTLTASHHQIINDLLPEILGTEPMILLERAAFDQSIDKDELRELSEYQNIGSDAIVDIINISRYFLLISGLLTMVYSMKSSFDIEDLYKGFQLAFSGIMLQFYPSGPRRPIVKLESSVAKYQKIFRGIQKQFVNYNKSAIGKIKRLLVQEIILAIQSDQSNEKIEFIWNFLQNLPEPELIEEIASSYPLETVNDVLLLIEQFNNSQQFISNPVITTSTDEAFSSLQEFELEETELEEIAS